MRHLGRWLLSAVLLGALPHTSTAQEIRPTVCVSADLSSPGATHARDKLLNEVRNGPPELVVAEAAVHSLDALRVFHFTTACPEIAEIRLRLVLTSPGRGWPTSELMLTAVLTVGGESYQAGLGVVLGRYETPEHFAGASWIQANLDQHIDRWDDSVRRLFSAIPIGAPAARAGDWVTLTGASYNDIHLQPDQAVLSGGSAHGLCPKVVFRVCDPERPSGPVVSAHSLQHCDELSVEPTGSPPTQQLPRVFLWRWGEM